MKIHVFRVQLDKKQSYYFGPFNIEGLHYIKNLKDSYTRRCLGWIEEVPDVRTPLLSENFVNLAKMSK